MFCHYSLQTSNTSTYTSQMALGPVQITLVISDQCVRCEKLPQGIIRLIVAKFVPTVYCKKKKLKKEQHSKLSNTTAQNTVRVQFLFIFIFTMGPMGDFMLILSDTLPPYVGGVHANRRSQISSEKALIRLPTNPINYLSIYYTHNSL